MPEGRRDPRIEAHIELIGCRAEQDGLQLAEALFRRCWPGGGGDRTEPAALAWVCRWGPRRIGPLPPACSCTNGRCHVCN
jgi:hypothetical protein